MEQMESTAASFICRLTWKLLEDIEARRRSREE